MNKILFFRFLISVFFLSSLVCKSQTALDITNFMFVQCKKIHTLNYDLKKQERIKGELVTQQSSIKLNINPFKIYLVQETPKKGVEVLYAQGANNNQAHINPNGFPWLSINLPPMGSMMRESQHHTIFESGYKYFADILQSTLLKYNSDIHHILKLDGSVVWDKQNCWSLTLTNTHFIYQTYTVLKGESILTIAAKFKLSEYMILEHNSSVKDYEDVKAGQVIQIPSDYSSKTTLYIDKVRHIPLLMKIYDDKGLFEQYEYRRVILNGIIQPEEFTKQYKDYHF